jgi:hypothetical protein
MKGAAVAAFMTQPSRKKEVREYKMIYERLPRSPVSQRLTGGRAGIACDARKAAMAAPKVTQAAKLSMDFPERPGRQIAAHLSVVD